SPCTATDGMSGYPTELDVGYRGKSLSLSGLAPTPGVRAALLAKLRGDLPPETEIATRLAVLPAADIPPPAEPVDLEPLAREVRSVETRLIRQALARSLRRTERRLAQARDELKSFADNATATARRQRAEAALKPANSALERLAAVTRKIADPTTSLSQLGETSADIREATGNVDRSYAEIAELLGGGRAPINSSDQQGDGADAESKASATDLASDLSASAERLASTIAAVRQAGSLRLPKPAAPQIVRETVKVTPDDRLAQFTRRNAIFFANGTTFRSPQAVAQQLDTLAERIKATDLLVRIVGYTDERGGLNRNNSLALERAETVRAELLDRGVPAQQLVAVGRASIRDLSPATGSDSPNRRAEFELGFIGETPQAPR
ncbi:MAG: OmpA family protein, partial [Pseudomonadota bacterium]